MAIYDRICRTCGCNFKGGPRAWYCPDCRAERKKKTDRESKARKRHGQTRILGSIGVCENCGAEYTVEGALQKYCPECQPIMHKKLDNRQGKEYYHTKVDKNERSAKRRKHYAENKEEINAKRRAKRKEKTVEE